VNGSNVPFVLMHERDVDLSSRDVCIFKKRHFGAVFY